MAMRIRDSTPTIRPAGLQFNKPNAEGITAELREADVPPTPKNIAPFRKSYQARVGCMARHFGFRNDPNVPDVPHGIRNEYASSAEECLKAAASFKGLSALSAENAEKKYLRNRKEPLGRVADPPYPLPEKTQKDNFAFGIASNKSENVKSVIYAGMDRDNEKVTSTDPGRQKDRKYDWAKVKIDPTKARFGRASSADGITTKELFQPPTMTKVMPRIVQDHQAVAMPHLAQTKNLGFGDRKQDKTFRYGFSRKMDSMGTRLLIGGSGLSVPQDDPQLGRSHCKSATLRKLRDQDAKARQEQGEDPNRAFGCPSVRLDLRRPRHRKVTNPNNYGDEPSGGSLLYPNPHGVDEELLLDGLTREEMTAFIGKCGDNLGVTDKQMQEALDRTFKSAKDGRAQLVTLNAILDEYTA